MVRAAAVIHHRGRIANVVIGGNNWGHLNTQHSLGAWWRFRREPAPWNCPGIPVFSQLSSIPSRSLHWGGDIYPSWRTRSLNLRGHLQAQRVQSNKTGG